MTRILATADFVVGNCARETSLRDEKSAYDAVHNNTRRRVLRTRQVGRLGLLYNIIGSQKSESDCESRGFSRFSLSFWMMIL